MWRSKKSKKPRQPSQEPASLGIPTHIATGVLGFHTTPDLGVRPEGANNGGVPQIPLPSGSEDQPPHTSGASTQTPERDDRPIMLQERARGVPSDTPNERVDQNSPDLHSNTRGSESQNARDEGQRTVAKVAKRDWKDTARGGAGILFDVAHGAADAFSPLKGVLSAISVIYKNYEETVAVRKKIEDLLSRIVVLEAIFRAPTTDTEEKSRRDELLRKLKDIALELRSLYEKDMKNRLQQFVNHAQNCEDVSMHLEDLQEAINDYKMKQQIAIYDHACKLIEAAQAVVLNNLPCARAAEYRHGSRNGCLKGTRGAVLDEIELWTRDFNKPPVYWLNGLAGTGKSTIAQTIAERVFADGRLGASFFCSRDFEDRSDLHFIFPTLAVQLARNHSNFRSIFVPLVQSDPGVSHESLYNQMNKLIVGPLKKSAISTVIVIDALDECKDEEPASAILSVLGQLVSQIPKAKFFLTGRPEPRIREGFRLLLLAKATEVFVLHDVEPSRVDSDIQLFLRRKFSEIAARRSGLDNWPTREQLNLLWERAAGLFVYAVATVKFIDHKNESPQNQLDRLLRSPENTAYEGKTKFNPKTTLDSLYLSILQEAFGDDEPEFDPKARSILGAVILAANPLSPLMIAALSGIDLGDVSRRLSSVNSLLILQDDVGSPVRSFHKSFPDFIVDPARCTNPRFLVSPPDHHSRLLIGCLELMNRQLEKNMCKLPDAVANSNVKDLRERTERYIGPSLQYACKSWHKHFAEKHTTYTTAITSTLHRFLEEKFLFWLEVLSVLGAAREAVDALEASAKWLEASPTLDLVNDYFRFVTRYFEIINESAPHIYHSALPLSPKTSIVRTLYERHALPLIRVANGLPTSWEQSIAIMTFISSVEAVVWSPCSKFIALVWGKSKGTIEVLDAVTLGRITVIHFQLGGTLWLVFSSDSRLLTWFGNSPRRFISWDLQTGVLVSSISPEQRGPPHCPPATYSTGGTTFGVSFYDGHTSTISTYDVRSGAHVCSHSVEGPTLDGVWTHGEHLRFATMKSGSITTWEVGFTTTDAPTEVQSLPVPSESHYMGQFLLHPTLPRLAFVTRGRVQVWDAQNSKFLLDSADVERPKRLSFSLDGRIFVCGAMGPELYLFKESPTGYALHRKLVPNIRSSKPLISPSGESIIAFGDSVIQLWRTTDSTTSLSTISTRGSQWSGKTFILRFSPDQTLAAFARMGDGMVTVLDLKSSTPRLTIDTSMEVHGLGVDENTIVVVGEGKIATWNLLAENRLLDPRANVDDCVCITTFRHPPFPAFALRPTTWVSPGLDRVAVVEGRGSTGPCLHLYDARTGRCLASAPTMAEACPWFAADGREIWCVAEDLEAAVWGIVEDGESNLIELEHLSSTTHLPDGFPWRSSENYGITNGHWLLTFRNEQLFWFPHHWRSEDWNRMWGERFLVLLNHELPEPVILELKGLEE